MIPHIGELCEDQGVVNALVAKARPFLVYSLNLFRQAGIVAPDSMLNGSGFPLPEDPVEPPSSLEPLMVSSCQLKRHCNSVINASTNTMSNVHTTQLNVPMFSTTCQLDQCTRCDLTSQCTKFQVQLDVKPTRSRAAVL